MKSLPALPFFALALLFALAALALDQCTQLSRDAAANGFNVGVREGESYRHAADRLAAAVRTLRPFSGETRREGGSR